MARAKPRIGMKEVCRLLGISSSTIRLYEQSLQDRHYETAESGHRIFSGASITQLFDVRFMSKCGFSLSGAAQACQDSNVSARLASYTAGEQVLVSQARYMSAALDETRRVKQLLSMVDNRQSKFFFEDVGAFYFLECERNGEIVTDAETLELIDQWTEMIPAVYLTNRDVPEDAAGVEWSFRMGLAISEQHASLVPTNHKAVRYVPPRRCVVGIVVDENTESLSDNVGYQYSGKILGFARRYFAENNVVLAGDVFHRFLGSSLEIIDPEGGQVVGDLWYGVYPVR